MANDKNSTSLASEFYVASILWRLGFEVSITMGHTKEIDLFARKGSSYAVIDVKGARQPPFLIQTRETYGDHSFYIFVLWQRSFENVNKTPRCFIVPAVDIPKVWSDIPVWGNQSKAVKLKELNDYESKWEYLEKK